MVRLSIENISENDFLDFLGVNNFPQLGDEIELPCGVKIISASTEGEKFIASPVFHFFIETLTAVSINIISAYIFTKISETKKAARLRVENNNVKIEEAAIKNELTSKFDGDKNEQE